MHWLVRYSVGFIVAVLAAEVLGAIFQVQGTIWQQFSPQGIEIPMDTQLSWTRHDIVGLLPSYGLILAAGFLIAFLVGSLISMLMPGLRNVIFLLAGAAAVLTIFLLAKPVIWNVTPIYGARDTIPLILQCIAGAFGGFLFAVISRKRGG